MKSMINHSEQRRTVIATGPISSPGTHGVERQCPYCNQKLSLKQIIELMHGHGWEEYIRVKLVDGSLAFVELGCVNPTLVEVLD
jgi:hypothetical protein